MKYGLPLAGMLIALAALTGCRPGEPCAHDRVGDRRG